MKEKKFSPHVSSWVKIASLLMGYDIATAIGSYFLALWVRFDCIYSQIPEQYLQRYLQYMWIHAAVSVAIFWAFRLYRTIWRFASYVELFRVVVASLVSGVVNTVLMRLLYGRMPISYYLFGLAFQTFFMAAARFGYRQTDRSHTKPSPSIGVSIWGSPSVIRTVFS